MKKTIITFVMTAILTISTLCIPVSYAAENTSNSPTPNEVVSELVKYENPYYGYSPMDFDFNNDKSIDVFDLVLLKQKLVAGEPEITIATAVKLQSYLLGKTYASLTITNHTPDWLEPSEFNNDCLKNLTSHDFRFVHAEETMIFYNNTDIPAVILHFLGIDEYTIDSIVITNFCNTPDEFDEFVTDTEGPGFSIGIKDGVYTLAVKKEQPQIGPALAEYDLTEPNLSGDQVRQTIKDLSNYLKAEPFKFTTKEIGFDKIQLSCNTELTDIEIIVYEFEPVKDTPVFESDEFYLFYDNTRGFGICLK